MVDNADWLLDLKWIEFLRDVGRHFTVNQLMQHGTYWERFQAGSFSFVELNYALVQAYDFLHLYREFGCVLQIGGNDQWFNILAGRDLIRHANGGEAFALTTPLITTTSGQKLGKSAGNAVWLDPELDVAVRVLPVLAEHRGRGRRPLHADVHLPAARGDRRVRNGSAAPN